MNKKTGKIQVCYKEQTCRGLFGLFTNSPPQFGQIFFISSVQGKQKVHSCTQIKAIESLSIEDVQRSHSF